MEVDSSSDRMFQALRKAVVGTYYGKDLRNTLVQDEYRKKVLKENITHRIKELQKRNLDGSSVIERNDGDAENICQVYIHVYCIYCDQLSTTLTCSQT